MAWTCDGKIIKLNYLKYPRVGFWFGEFESNESFSGNVIISNDDIGLVFSGEIKRTAKSFSNNKYEFGVAHGLYSNAVPLQFYFGLASTVFAYITSGELIKPFISTSIMNYMVLGTSKLDNLKYFANHLKAEWGYDNFGYLSLNQDLTAYNLTNIKENNIGSLNYNTYEIGIRAIPKSSNIDMIEYKEDTVKIWQAQ
jgi:hypothetical protein